MCFLAFLLILSSWAGASPLQAQGLLEILQTLAQQGNTVVHVAPKGTAAQAAVREICEAGPPSDLVILTAAMEAADDATGDACVVLIEDTGASLTVRVTGRCRTLPGATPTDVTRHLCTLGDLPASQEAPSPAPTLVGPSVCPDEDGDGYTARSCGGRDCNDQWAEIHPGAFDVPGDAIDQDCNGKDRRLLQENPAVLAGAVIGSVVVAALVAALIIVAGAFLIALIIVISSSCPFVYVETPDGWRLAGEPFSGAVVRALQRPDLVPLPVDAAGTVRTRIVAVSPETEYIDHASLVVVDHDPAVRALTTSEANVVLVAPAQGPTSAVDLAGHDVLPLLADDEWFWETDMDGAVGDPGAVHGEGLVVTFRDPPVGPEGLALELHAGNTPWQALLWGAIEASMGDRIERFQRRGEDPARREPLLAWRKATGLDLVVERRMDEDTWEEVAVVPSLGWVALRRLCVVLPPDPGPDLTLRLRGGTGFWRIRHLGLAPIVDADPAVAILPPRLVLGPEDTDPRAALDRSDGVYSVLPEPGQELALTFEPGPIPPDLARTAFLAVDGYYEPHTPPDARFHPRLVRRLKHRPEWASELSVEVYRLYAEATEEVALAGPGGA